MSESTFWHSWVSLGWSLAHKYGRRGAPDPGYECGFAAREEAERESLIYTTKTLSAQQETIAVLSYIAWLLDAPLRAKAQNADREATKVWRDAMEWLNAQDPPCPQRCAERLQWKLTQRVRDLAYNATPLNVDRLTPGMLSFRPPAHWSHLPERIAGKRTKMQKCYEEWLLELAKAERRKRRREKRVEMSE